MSALHEAVARAMQDAADEITPRANDPGWDLAAAAAIGLVLAEAQRAVLAAIDASDDYYISGYVNGEIHALVEAALAALGEQA